MNLDKGNIFTSSEMKKKFVENCQAYCRDKEIREDVVRMTPNEEKHIEYYVKKFNYNLHKTRQENLAPKTLSILLLRGI